MGVLYKELKDHYDTMTYIHNEDGTIRGMTLWFSNIVDPIIFKRKFQDYRFWEAKVEGFYYKMKYESFRRLSDNVLGVQFEIAWE